ncbi:M23 family metallopeptidase [Serpentinicella sp. ANB-PHB4]|uniref:M23 family metallopeptidase n=1 Tax=Serpentinicella sp. ANB-PHB4 TaxID=3074076 RepID=UPI0028628502|nr:M23 family metallopeptidase [Serpentinicella sp. ANB-PHB4]MDR5659643.1 M23 family metallopeptidase [Serpentinicella sp. ANB-PHB4]
MIKKFKHIREKNKKLTFMIVPNSTKEIKQFTISYNFILSLITGGAMLTLALVVLSGGFFYLNNNYQEASQQIIVLQEENQQQKETIAFYNARAEEVDERIERLSHLENKVLDMIGTEQKEKPNNLVVSRSNTRMPLLAPTVDVDLENLEDLNDLIETQEKQMNVLINDINEQLDVLEAIPNRKPATGRISSPFGDRIHPVTRRLEFHNGVDIANSRNTNIYAAAGGVVTFSGYNGSYGRMITISHGNGYTSLYAHNNKNLVSVGDRVSKGDLIAKMGSTGRSTGPHVHFEIRLNGEPIDPMTAIEN